MIELRRSVMPSQQQTHNYLPLGSYNADVHVQRKEIMKAETLYASSINFSSLTSSSSFAVVGFFVGFLA